MSAHDLNRRDPLNAVPASGDGAAPSRSSGRVRRSGVARRGRLEGRKAAQAPGVAVDTRKATRAVPAAVVAVCEGAERLILAHEGPHGVALVPVVSGGFAYELVYFQRVTGKFVRRVVSPSRDQVRSVLYWLECRHAEPLGASAPGFGVRLHRRMGAGCYPADVAALSVADAARLPVDVDCNDGL